MRRTIPFLLAALLTATVAHADWPEGGIVLATSETFAWGNFQMWRTPAGELTSYFTRNSNSGAVRETRTVAADGTVILSRSLDDVALDAISPDGAGGVFVVNDGPPRDVRLHRVIAPGTLLPSPTGWTVSATGATEMLPIVEADGEGGCYVAWLHASSVRLRRMNFDGSNHAAWPDTGVVLGSAIPLRLLRDGTQGAFVLWIGGTNFRLQHVTPSGTITAGWPAGGVAWPADGVTLSGEFLPLIPSTDGAVLVPWTKTPSGQPTRVMLRRVLATGVLDPAWPVDGVEVAMTGAPIKIVSDGLGGAHIGWADAGFHLKRILVDGTTAPGFPAEGINPADAGTVFGSPDFAIATGNAGGVIIAWDDSRSPRSNRIRWLQGDGTPYPLEPLPPRIFEADPTGGGNSIALVSDGGSTAWALHSGHRGSPFPRAVLISELHAPGTVDVPPAPRANLALSAWPNPARSEFRVRFALPDHRAAALVLYDIGGRTVATRTVSGAGEHIESFASLERLEPGLFFVRLQCGAESRTARVVLTR